MAMVSTTDSDRGMASCLQQARVPPALQSYLVGTLQMEVLEDFVHYVRKDAAEAGLVALVDSVEDLRDNKLVHTRLIAAWNLGKDALAAAQTAAATGSSATDLEQALPDHNLQALEADWKRCYGLQIDVNLQPSDSLLGRTYREFRRRTATVIEAKRIRNVLADKQPAQKQSVPLPSGVRVEIEQVDEVPITSTVEY